MNKLVYQTQRTVRRAVSCSGIGLHSGQKGTLRLRPAEGDSGIVFKRLDLAGTEISARIENLSSINYATGLANNAASVETVEHLLAALVGLGIDNVIVELNQAEVPINPTISPPPFLARFTISSSRSSEIK